MTNSESRIYRLEQALRLAEQQIRDLQVLVGQLQQNQLGSIIGTGGGGSAGIPLFCVLSGGIAASGTIGSGSPGGPLASQTVYSIISGAYTSVSSSASIYNGLPNALSTGAKCIVEANGDNTYSVIAVAC
jgi:hypothetical protein